MMFFTPQDVIEWLRKQPKDTVVHSMEDTPSNCTIAKYIQDVYNNPTLYAGFTMAGDTQEAEYMEDLPAWCCETIIDLDTRLSCGWSMTAHNVALYIERYQADKTASRKKLRIDRKK